MRNLMIPALILFALAYSCQSLEPIKISQESGMSILANITPAPANQSEINATLNQTNQTRQITRPTRPILRHQAFGAGEKFLKAMS